VSWNEFPLNVALLAVLPSRRRRDEVPSPVDAPTCPARPACARVLRRSRLVTLAASWVSSTRPILAPPLPPSTSLLADANPARGSLAPPNPHSPDLLNPCRPRRSGLAQLAVSRTDAPALSRAAHVLSPVIRETLTVGQTKARRLNENLGSLSMPEIRNAVHDGLEAIHALNRPAAETIRCDPEPVDT
jgi:hypothetical protein